MDMNVIPFAEIHRVSAIEGCEIANCASIDRHEIGPDGSLELLQQPDETSLINERFVIRKPMAK